MYIYVVGDGNVFPQFLFFFIFLKGSFTNSSHFLISPHGTFFPGFPPRPQHNIKVHWQEKPWHWADDFPCVNASCCIPSTGSILWLLFIRLSSGTGACLGHREWLQAGKGQLEMGPPLHLPVPGCCFHADPSGKWAWISSSWGNFSLSWLRCTPTNWASHLRGQHAHPKAGRGRLEREREFSNSSAGKRGLELTKQSCLPSSLVIDWIYSRSCLQFLRIMFSSDAILQSTLKTSTCFCLRIPEQFLFSPFWTRVRVRVSSMESWGDTRGVTAKRVVQFTFLWTFWAH